MKPDTRVPENRKANSPSGAVPHPHTDSRQVGRSLRIFESHRIVSPTGESLDDAVYSACCYCGSSPSRESTVWTAVTPDNWEAYAVTDGPPPAPRADGAPWTPTYHIRRGAGHD